MALGIKSDCGNRLAGRLSILEQHHFAVVFPDDSRRYHLDVLSHKQGFRVLVAKRAQGFDMEILYYDRKRVSKAEKEFGARRCTLDELLSESDFVSLHVNLNDETRNLIGSRELDLIRVVARLWVGRWPGCTRRRDGS